MDEKIFLPAQQAEEVVSIIVLDRDEAGCKKKKKFVIIKPGVKNNNISFQSATFCDNYLPVYQFNLKAAKDFLCNLTKITETGHELRKNDFNCTRFNGNIYI
jgi:hypothetical protein